MKVAYLVDDPAYIKANCYQHQLQQALHASAQVETVSAADITSGKKLGPVDSVVCCLKQRTLYRLNLEVQRYLNGARVVVYDQDPWEAYRDDSPYKGAYDKLRMLNLGAIALTTQWWAQRLQNEFNLPGEFVKMGMLPEYCDIGPSFEFRSSRVGFIGTLHPRRAQLFERLRNMKIDVVTQGNTLGYSAYLQALHNIGIFVHNEDHPIVVNGQPDNMGKGMWIKDVEAAARGCFSVRNNEAGATTYCSDIPTIMLYDDVAQVPDIVSRVTNMDKDERRHLVRTAVGTIAQQDDWSQTAKRLIELGSQKM